MPPAAGSFSFLRPGCYCIAPQGRIPFRRASLSSDALTSDGESGCNCFARRRGLCDLQGRPAQQPLQSMPAPLALPTWSSLENSQRRPTPSRPHRRRLATPTPLPSSGTLSVDHRHRKCLCQPRCSPTSRTPFARCRSPCCLGACAEHAAGRRPAPPVPLVSICACSWTTQQMARCSTEQPSACGQCRCAGASARSRAAWAHGGASEA